MEREQQINCPHVHLIKKIFFKQTYFTFMAADRSY